MNQDPVDRALKFLLAHKAAIGAAPGLASVVCLALLGVGEWHPIAAAIIAAIGTGCVGIVYIATASEKYLRVYTRRFLAKLDDERLPVLLTSATTLKLDQYLKTSYEVWYLPGLADSIRSLYSSDV